jgi:type I restriction enzyme, S subunit
MAMYGANVGQLGILKRPATVNQAICGLIINKKVADPYFIFYSLLFHRIRIIQQARGAAQQNLNQDIIKSFVVELPTLLNQRKIAAILSAYDDLIENNTRRIQILEEMAQAIYREWFVHFRFPGHEGVRMMDSGTELGEVPEGWEVVKVGDLYNTSSGGTPSRKEPHYWGGTINWLKTRELNDRFILETEEKISNIGLKKSSAKVFPKQTVVLAMYGATIGKLGILSESMATNQACCAILEKTCPYTHVFAFLSMLINREKLINLGMGAAQQNISQIVIREFEIVKPPKNLVKEFNNLVNPFLDGIRVLQKKNHILYKCRNLLVPKLISGEIDVGDMEVAGLAPENEDDVEMVRESPPAPPYKGGKGGL